MSVYHNRASRLFWETNLKILKVSTKDPRLKISCHLLVFYCCIFLFFFSVCLFFPSREFLCTVILCRKSVCGKIRLLKVKAILLQRKEINSFFLALTPLNDAFTILTVIADSFVIRRYSDDKVVSFIEIKKYIWQLPMPLCHALFRWILNNCLW